MSELDQVVNKLKKYSNVMAVYLFGSHAKNKAKSTSDIDIAVIVKNPDKKTETNVGLIAAKPFDVANFHRLPLYIQFEVFKHGKELFVRNKTFVNEVKFDTLRQYRDMFWIYERHMRRTLG